MDIGAEEIVVAVPPDRAAQPVRAFRTFTPDLHALAAWLEACGIDTVAMESTGVYWIPIFELLEARGLVPYLVNARHPRSSPDARAIGTTSPRPVDVLRSVMRSSEVSMSGCDRQIVPSL